MYIREKVIDFLNKHLAPWRVEHSIRVMNMAIELAHKHGVDVEKAEIAALLHDSGKWANDDEALKKVESYGIIVDGELAYDFNMIHPILGVYIAREEFGIYDKEILDAIRFHMSGHWSMTKLEKIIFLADKLEPSRDYEKVDEFRRVAENDMDAAIKQILDATIRVLLDRNAYIALDSIEARNYFIVRNKRDGN